MKANFYINLAKDQPKDARFGMPAGELARRISRFIARDRRPLIVAMGFILGLSVVQTLIPQIIRYTIDVIIPGARYDLLPWIAAVFLGAALLIGGMNFGRTYMMSLFGQRVVNSLRTALYCHVQRLSVSFFDNRRTGELMSRLDRDVETIGKVITADVADILADSLTCLLIIGFLLFQDWRLTLLLLITWPLRIHLNRRFGRSLRGAYREVQERSEAISSQLQETLSTISVTKAFGNERHEIRRFSKQSRHLMEANLRAVRRWAVLHPIVDLLNHIGTIIVLVFGAWEVMNGGMTIGGLAAFLAYINLINQPIKRFSRLSNIIHAAIVAWERVFDLLDTEPEVRERPDAKPLPVFQGHVRFEDVGFAYRRDEPVIHDFDLDIRPGMMVALVGSSGAGKSTIAKLAARFHDPQQGRILLDGHDIRDLTLGSLRSHVGIVAQDSLLLYGTVRDNIVYGKLDATDAEIEAAAIAANAHDFIMALPNGYDTPIGERGVRLSGGQRQRLAIARVLVRNAGFVILDEATSALDTETERVIQQTLDRLFENRTSLVIAHRLSTIRRADRIVVMEGGRIVEQGTHDDLLAHGGRYARLHDLQFSLQTSTLSDPTDTTHANP